MSTKSLRFKIFAPILLISILVMFITTFITRGIIEVVEKEYLRFIVQHHSFEIKKILEKAVTEITSAQFLKQEMVMDAKKLDVLESIRLYWNNHGFEGLVMDSEGISPYMLSTLSRVDMNDIGNRLSNTEFIFNKGGDTYYGVVIDFPLWKWKIVSVAYSVKLSETQGVVNSLVPIYVISILVIAAGILYLINKKIETPVKQMVSSIEKGELINPVDLTEFDTIGGAMNHAIVKLKQKNDHLRILHNNVLEMQKFFTQDEILSQAVSCFRHLFSAEGLAIAAENSKIYTDREYKSVDAAMLAFIKRISGRLSDTQDTICLQTNEELRGFLGTEVPALEVRNLCVQPVNKSDETAVAFILCINKEGGFSAYDITLLQLLSSDISTALVRAEDVSRLKRFQKVIDSAFDMIVISDSEGFITYVNPSFETITGYCLDEVTGKRANILKSGNQDEAFYKSLWATLKSGNVWKGEFTNKKKGGELYQESAVIFPVSFDGNINYVAIKRDITQEKKLYEQLVRAQKMEAIGTLAGGIAHDFNNLLTAILGYSEIMLSQLKEGERLHKPARIINDAAQNAAELTKKILTVTRKEKTEARPVNVNEIVSNALEIISHSIPKNIEIIAKLTDNIPMIQADPSQIHQLIINLSVNARDAMPDGGKLCIETSIVGAAKGVSNGIEDIKGEFVKISVSDTGIGISTDMQQKVFDPFFTTKGTGKGTGLGLYIVHSIVSNHNGYINLYSEQGKGTRFNIYLPAIRAEGDADVDPTMDLKGEGTLLIIDDEEDVRSVCIDMLSGLGYNVITASDGMEGISKYSACKDEISLVILDMIMPRMGGNEVFQTLRTINPNAKIILCSGFSHDGYAGIDKMLSKGAMGFVQKPFSANAIGAAVKNALRGA